jgi:DNA-binding transcriptional MerR regulator
MIKIKICSTLTSLMRCVKKLDHDVASYLTLEHEEEKTMKQWYAKELAKLAHVSVRTLHHYDKIDLLKPSLRESNNYRLYSETDLLKLQQIIALKFFGFDLSQIKHLLNKHDDFLENFELQSTFLREKAASLLEADSILTRISHDCSNNKSIPWKKIIELIEVYKMTQQLEDAWVKEIFTPDELKEYSDFEAEMKSNATLEQKKIFEKDWFNLVDEFKENLQTDPSSEVGIELGRKLMDWINNLFGTKYAHLRTKKFEQGFGEGKGLEKNGLTPEIVSWMEKAMDAYWRQRIQSILFNVGNVSSSESLTAWNHVMDEMYGKEEARKATIPVLAFQDDSVSQEAKNWLKKVFKL